MKTSGRSFYSLRLGDLVVQYESLFPFESRAQAVVELASSIANSPPLHELECVVAVRDMPASMLMITDEDHPELEKLGRLDQQIISILDRTRYVDWSGVDEAVDALARRLLEELGEGYVAGAEFEAIPKSGHIVLGLLSYRLGLSTAQTERSGESERPLILVDDCALSGLRFKEVLSSVPDREVVFATLLSPAALRTAIKEAEPAVVACVSGVDLVDFADVMPPEERERWVDRWKERGEVYWTGQPEHIVFPWGETDVGIWNPVAELVEPGWQVGPPSLRIAQSEPQRQVQLANPGSGSLQLAPSALYASLGNDIGVFQLDSSTAWHLEGTAAEMWRALLVCHSLSDAAGKIAARSGVEFETVLADLEVFADELLSNDLLVDRSSQSNRPS